MGNVFEIVKEALRRNPQLGPKPARFAISACVFHFRDNALEKKKCVNYIAD